jgi:hypothetical protein
MAEPDQEKKKAGRPSKPLNFSIKTAFWCKELKVMILSGAYKAKDADEAKIIEKYIK